MIQVGDKMPKVGTSRNDLINKWLKPFTCFKYDGSVVFCVICEKKFEEEFKPSKLRNWEVQKWYPERPCGNRGKTPVISNEHGHLLPGVPRAHRSPWGDFVGTWDLPKKIDRNLAKELSAPRKDKILKWKRHCEQQGGPLPRIPKITRVKVPTDLPDITAVPSDIHKPGAAKIKEELSRQKESPKLEEPKAKQDETSVGEKMKEKPLCPIHDYY